jgi:hypothetical protein
LERRRTARPIRSDPAGSSISISQRGFLRLPWITSRASVIRSGFRRLTGRSSGLI